MISQPYVIVLGNEKGGTGKSTVAVHIIASLLHAGHNVGSIDVDARQGTLTRYLENRDKYIKDNKVKLLTPSHNPVYLSENKSVDEANKEEESSFSEAMEKLKGCDYVVVDTPGGNTYLSRFAHSFADTLITPLNDSFIDLDLLAHIENGTLNVNRLSIYAENVWEFKKNKALRNRGNMNWIVLRNRLSQLNAKNKEYMEEVLGKLEKRIGFKHVPGFSERVIFRELFMQGLTLLDLTEVGEKKLNLSHVAARQELRTLITALGLSKVNQRVKDAV